jgi:peptide/nickel transport system ATP-binding protein
MSATLTLRSPSATASDAPVLEISNLAVAYRSDDEFQRVVHNVSLQVRPGEVVALVGESGSGKTTTAQAVIGLLVENGRLESGAIRLNGTDIAGWSQKRLDSIRGSKISLIPQDPTGSLNPVKTIGAQVAEVFQIHRQSSKQAIEARVVDLLARVGLSQPELRARQYPHELSGGMRQRVLIAIAVAMRPALIIADEPTSALDVTVQKRILDLIDGLREEYGTAVLLVTHDLGVAADRADRLVVLKGGRIQEQGPTAEVLASPRSEYTRKLLADAPSLAKAQHVSRTTMLRGGERDHAIVVENLVQDFQLDGRRGIFRAVDGISFKVPRGTTHAIVGESGSGKTTTARSVVGFQKPTSGRILVDGIDVTTLRGKALRQFRRKIQLVYQNPFASLDPLQTIFQIVEEPLLNFDPVPREDRARKVHAILDRVGLSQSVLARKPRALSGGQRQRVAIARALVLDPQVLVLDEAVSALDVTVQAQILGLLNELQQALGLTYLFISHDLAVVRQISDTVSVLQNGRQVDSGSVEDVFLRPGSPYTRELIGAIPGQRNLTMRDAPNPFIGAGQ